MKPKVILGDFTGRREPRLQELGWGRMKIDRSFTPKGKHGGQWMHYKGEPWALDNGAYIQWSRQDFSPTASYDFSTFERMLTELERTLRLDPTKAPLFVVVPDRPAQGLESLWFSLEWIHAAMKREDLELWQIRFYLALQDGMTPADLHMECEICGEPVAEHFAGLFLGGSAAFKKSALEWSAQAKGHGLGFHYARAGTIEKLRHAHLVGADSLDSAFPMFLSSRWSAFEDAWLDLGKTPFSKSPFQMEIF